MPDRPLSTESDGLYVVLVQSDDDTSDWWKKATLTAEGPDEALEQAWAGTYSTPSRSGSPRRRYRCVVVGRDVGWREYNVTVEAQPSTVVIEAAR